MSSLFDSLFLQTEETYINSKSDLAGQKIDINSDIGEVCLVIFSSNIFKKTIDLIDARQCDFEWTFNTTDLVVFKSLKNKKRFCVHFPSYGGARTANSLEQLAALGVKKIYAVGLAGGIQDFLRIKDIILLEGSVRGDGASRYYVPSEFPAIASFSLVSQMKARLDSNNEEYHMGLSFGTDALYRESIKLADSLKKLGVLSIDMESSALFSISRKLGLQSCWIGIISDLLLNGKHEGTAHSEIVAGKLLQLTRYVMDEIEHSLTV
ncbi:MAG: nucleoside phosphorylase [Gammaproteobacteria bacterium]|nr:nucleoside phosphorylase [Gammaproteobacteria bacterium]